MNEKEYIEDLLKMLQSPKADKRYEACERLRGVPEITPEAIKALQEAVNDPNKEVVDAARRALAVQLTPEPPSTGSPMPRPETQPEPPLSTTKKIIHIASGFVGWFLINGIAWWFCKGDPVGNSIINLFFFFFNITALFTLSVIRKTRWIALGILAAWVVNLLISIIFGMFWNGVCLVPFYFDIGF